MLGISRCICGMNIAKVSAQVFFARHKVFHGAKQNMHINLHSVISHTGAKLRNGKWQDGPVLVNVVVGE